MNNCSSITDSTVVSICNYLKYNNNDAESARVFKQLQFVSFCLSYLILHYDNEILLLSLDDCLQCIIG